MIHGWWSWWLLAESVFWPPACQVFAWRMIRRAGIRLPLFGPHLRMASAGGAIGCALVNAVFSDWPAFGAAVAVGVLGWWLNRPRGPRKRRLAAPAAALARIAAMVTTMRERARPRTVLRPGLGGAR